MNKSAKKAKPAVNVGTIQKTFQPKPSALAVAIHQARQNWFELSAMTVYSDED